MRKLASAKATQLRHMLHKFMKLMQRQVENNPAGLHTAQCNHSYPRNVKVTTFSFFATGFHTNNTKAPKCYRLKLQNQRPLAIV